MFNTFVWSSHGVSIFVSLIAVAFIFFQQREKLKREWRNFLVRLEVWGGTFKRIEGRFERVNAPQASAIATPHSFKVGASIFRESDLGFTITAGPHGPSHWLYSWE
jgi:hypothetical protein